MLSIEGKTDINLSSAGIDFRSDVCGRQILTSKVDPRTERVKIFIMAVDKLKTPFFL